MGEWGRFAVADLEREGTLLVQDGNHGNDRPRPDEFVAHGVAFIRAADMRGGRIDFSGAERINDTAARRIRKGIGRPGDVLLSHKGTVGRVAFAPEGSPPFVCSPQTTFWRSLDQDRLDRDYLRFFLESPDFVEQLDSRKSETDMAPYVSLTEQRRLTVVLPSLSVQRAIGAVLGALDDKIASNRRLVDLLEAVSFSEYLMATEDADDAPYTDALKVEMGASFLGEHFSPPGLGRPLVRIRDLKTMAPQTWTTEVRPDETVVSAGDVLVGMDAEFRSTLWLGDPGVLNQRMCRFVPRPGVALAFAWFAIRPDLEYFERAKSGTTVIHLNKSDINRFSVPRLPIDEHRQLQERADPLIQRLVSAGRESRHLVAVRNALLPELLSGRLRAREAEKVIEDVV